MGKKRGAVEPCMPEIKRKKKAEGNKMRQRTWRATNKQSKARNIAQKTKCAIRYQEKKAKLLSEKDPFC